jgi:hypothetical protein
MMNRYMTGTAAVLICAFLRIGAPASAANIAWISFHPTDDPHADAATQGGFTEASDIGYLNLLRDSGHSVTPVSLRVSEVARSPVQQVFNIRLHTGTAGSALRSGTC